jgi:hypothetical protein
MMLFISAGTVLQFGLKMILIDLIPYCPKSCLTHILLSRASHAFALASLVALCFIPLLSPSHSNPMLKT